MDNFSALMKLDELVSSMKKKEEKSKTRDAIVIALAILGVVAAVAGIAYAVYRFICHSSRECTISYHRNHGAFFILQSSSFSDSLRQRKRY